MTRPAVSIRIICPYCATAFPIDADTIDAVRQHVDDCGESGQLDE